MIITLERLRQRVADRRVTRLAGQSLTAGVVGGAVPSRRRRHALGRILSHRCSPTSRSARSESGMNGGRINPPRPIPTVNVTGGRRQAERATGIAWLVAVRFCRCAAPMTLWCWCLAHGRISSQRRPRWRLLAKKRQVAALLASRAAISCRSSSPTNQCSGQRTANIAFISAVA